MAHLLMAAYGRRAGRKEAVSAGSGGAPVTGSAVLHRLVRDSPVHTGKVSEG